MSSSGQDASGRYLASPYIDFHAPSNDGQHARIIMANILKQKKGSLRVITNVVIHQKMSFAAVPWKGFLIIGNLSKRVLTHLPKSRSY